MQCGVSDYDRRNDGQCNCFKLQDESQSVVAELRVSTANEYVSGNFSHRIYSHLALYPMIWSGSQDAGSGSVRSCDQSTCML